MTIEHLLREERSRRTAMWRGVRGQCPQCGEKTLFRKYLKISDTCSACGLALSGHQADDAPPYFTIFIVGHVIVPVALIVERSYTPPLYVHAILFCLLAIVVSMITLPLVKGAVVGLQWALRMHGFAPAPPESEEDNE
ncbi:MAG: DUF983 domain-containing protein [Alphaproteobacteria bacterium]|nr:DUF983 domain-containing protein [Alphaproteobacteria bacterium]